jgi:hypothetical protein
MNFIKGSRLCNSTLRGAELRMTTSCTYSTYNQSLEAERGTILWVPDSNCMNRKLVCGPHQRLRLTLSQPVSAET